jgi:hypothetical protein
LGATLEYFNSPGALQTTIEHCWLTGAVEISLEPQVITLAVLVLELTVEPWKLNLKLRGLPWSHIGFP